MNNRLWQKNQTELNTWRFGGAAFLNGLCRDATRVGVRRTWETIVFFFFSPDRVGFVVLLECMKEQHIMMGTRVVFGFALSAFSRDPTLISRQLARLFHLWSPPPPDPTPTFLFPILYHFNILKNIIIIIKLK